jgi:hypothetical protein
MKITVAEAQKQGFLVDTTCYPWTGYKGPRFNPTELVHVWTEAEADMLEALAEIAKGEVRYNRDNYVMCCNTIEDMKAIAERTVSGVNGRYW